MKKLYSVLDGGLVGLVTQPLQNLANSDTARRVGGKIIYYILEPVETLASHALLRTKLGTAEEIDGFVFFRLKQFHYGPAFDYALLLKLIDMGYEVHVTREGISFRSRAEVEALLPDLLALELLEAPNRRAGLRHFLGADFESLGLIVG
jgi:hypothetical protein